MFCRMIKTGFYLDVVCRCWLGFHFYVIGLQCRFVVPYEQGCASL